MFVKTKKIQQTLDGIQEQLVSAAKAKVEQQAKAAKEEGDKYRAEFAKKDGVKSTKDGLLYKITEAGKGDAIKATDTAVKYITPVNYQMVKYLIALLNVVNRLSLN